MKKQLCVMAAACGLLSLASNEKTIMCNGRCVWPVITRFL